MKKTLKIILSLVLAVAVLSSVFALAAGTPAVMYDGKAKTVEIKNALPFGMGDKPDLFADFKNVMPGDSFTQEIKVGAKNLGGSIVKMYLRAANLNEDFETLLNEYSQWIQFTVKNGDTEITGDLTSGVLLGEFDKNGSVTVTVTVAIDPTAGNELQPLVSEVDWIFTAEVTPSAGGGGGGGGGTEPTPTPTPGGEPTPSPEPSNPVDPTPPGGGGGEEVGDDEPGTPGAPGGGGEGGESDDEAGAPGRPVLPLTGVERRPIWILLGLGIALIIVGVFQLGRRREEA